MGLTGFSHEQNHMKKILVYSIFGILVLSINSGLAWEWNTTPDIPGYDTRWQRFEDMWDNRCERKNIDAMIDLVQQLETDHPDKIEPKLWLGKLFTLKGKYLKKDGADYFKKAEGYAQKAHQIDPENIIALKILLDALPYIGDLDYALSKHGPWIKSAVPLKTGYEVPPMTGNSDWEEAVSLWNQRAGGGFDEITAAGLEAVKKFNRLAEKSPEDILANAWACRANYDIGQYYSSIGRHEEKGFAYYHDSIKYGNLALLLDPYYLPARYWSMLSQARMLQDESILTKARYVNKMIADSTFGLREDSLYNYYGYTLAIASMITNGGWAAKEGLSLAGIEVQTLINQLRLAQVVYPTKFYVLYSLADLYFYLKEEKKAQEVLEKIFSLDPDMDPLIKLESRSVVRFSRELQEKINLKK